MADQAVPQIGHLTIQCTICMEIFKRPKVLTCGHSFCRECLVQMIRVGRGSFNCPNCREEHHVGKGGVDEIRDNYALGSIVDSLQATLGTQAAQGGAPAAAAGAAPAAAGTAPAAGDAPPVPAKRWSFFSRATAPKQTPPKPEPKQEQKEKREVPTCVRHPGKKLEAACEQCEDSICGECISTKCRPQGHEWVSIKEKADMIRIRLKLLLLGAAFSNLKDNMTLGEGLVEGGKVVAQAERVRAKVIEAHARALTFAEQREKQYTEIIDQSMAAGSGTEASTVHLQMLQRQFGQLEEVSQNYRGATNATLGRESMQEIVGNTRQVLANTRRVIAEAQPPGSQFEFIGYPPDGSVGELVYDQSSTIGVLSLSGGRLIIARDDRRVAGVCIGEVYQDKPADVKWLFTLKPANYIAHVIFCTLSLSTVKPEKEQQVLIAVGQEIFVIDVNSSKYPDSEGRCPAQGILTVCPKSMPKNATITGIDWFPVTLPDETYGFSTEFVIYTTDQSHDLTVVSTSTRLTVKVISSSIFLSLIRCHVIDDNVAILVRKSSDAKVLMINPDGTIKHTFAAPVAKPDANPTLLCWVENPTLMAAVLWVPVTSRGWEIVLYNARTGGVERTIHGTGATPTGLDGLLPDKIVMCFNDGGVRICSSAGRQIPRNQSSIR